MKPMSPNTYSELAHFVHMTLKSNKPTAGLPNENVLTQLFEVLFYSSLQTEEGRFINVTITFLDNKNIVEYSQGDENDSAYSLCYFKRPIEFNIKKLVKLSKAADPWSSSLAVVCEEDKLKIIGMIDQGLQYQSYLNHEADDRLDQPSLFQATITGIGCINVLSEFRLLASLRQNIIIKNYIDVFNYGPVKEFLLDVFRPLEKSIRLSVDSFFTLDITTPWPKHLKKLITQSVCRILMRIQNYNHGGAILITPNSKSDLNIKYEFSYSKIPECLKTYILEMINNEIVESFSDPQSSYSRFDYYEKYKSTVGLQKIRSELRGIIRYIASLACIDGLVVIGTNLKVYGFGAIVENTDLPEYIFISKTGKINRQRLIQIDPTHFGTRHRSMISYCWKNKGSLGFVVSQDGEIRAIMRVEDKIILWENLKVQQFLSIKKEDKHWGSLLSSL